MTSKTQIALLGVALFAASCATCVALYLSRQEAGASARAAPSLSAPLAEPRVAWRAQLGGRGGRPCPVSAGWVVADAAGFVAKVTQSGGRQWQVVFSNEVFAGAAEVAGGGVAVGSESGRVFCLNGETGETLWRRETAARFQHVPLAGLREGEPVVWLVSQEDGTLYCLRASDGAVVWTTEATNRCDGEPAAWGGRIAYGNCDGAVYIFASLDGKPLGKVEVGESDQMAGGVLALPSGRLVTGTRAGFLVLINPDSLSCDARVKVSESEAFVTPAAAPRAHVAMGTEEGEVTLWTVGDKELLPAGRWAVGAAVTSLASARETLCALAGGVLCAIDSREGAVRRLPLGDEVGLLAVNADGDVACVADGALVCVKGLN